MSAEKASRAVNYAGVGCMLLSTKLCAGAHMPVTGNVRLVELSILEFMFNMCT